MDLYDGRYIANFSETVVVTANYRLGVLGFMTLNEFTGNFGVLDQRLALQWVQANAAGFGGDATAVTIFGQSAGGSSVSFHLVSPGSKPYFHKAIVQSSPFSLPILDTKSVRKHYEHFAAETKCKTADSACLLSLSWEEVVAAQTSAQQKIYVSRPLSAFYPWTPHVDGVELTADPLTMMQRGQYSKVPLIIGHVLQEGWLFIFDAFTKPVSKAEAYLLIDFMFHGNELPEHLFDIYPLPENTTDLRPWVSWIASDFIMKCPGRNVSNIFAAAGLPVYRYEFNHVWSVSSGWGPNYTFCSDAVCHGAELPFEFNSAGLLDYNFTAAEKSLSSTMTSYWGSFAHHAPGAPGLPNWPQQTPGTDLTLSFETAPGGITTLTDNRKKECDFWDTYGYIQP